MDDAITIRRAESIDDYRACQQAQRRSWGIVDDSYIVPLATMVGAQLHGGLVLGAFLPDGSAAGFSFGFLGRVGGRLCLYSQLTGIVPEYQSRGLGAKLKYAQRDIAKAEGLPCIAWAFDPLQAGNARFNLNKLGAAATRYIDNMYGFRTDALNAGVPTDRLIVEWETCETSARIPLADDEIDRIPHLTDDVVPPRGETRLLVDIPADIARLRRERPEEAELWRQDVRREFLAAFGAGYAAVGFVRGSYVLEPRST